jgi:hypothetical protein
MLSNLRLERLTASQTLRRYKQLCLHLAERLGYSQLLGYTAYLYRLSLVIGQSALQ